MLSRVITNVLLVITVVLVSAKSLSALPLVPTEIFAESFDTNTANLAATELAYPDMSGLGTVNVTGQQLQIIRGSNNNLLTDQSFNEEIWVSGDIGLFAGTGGNVAPGLVIGDLIFQFFPGFTNGAFRIYDYVPGTGAIGAPQRSSPTNISMGFTPAQSVLHHFMVHSDNTGNFDVQIDDASSSAVYMASFNITGFVPGKVGFSLLHSSGTALYDNLSVIALREQVVPEPSSFLLLGLGALGLVRHTRRRRRKA